MKSTRRDDRHYMSSVRVGPKGQIVIPKEAREMFGIEPGDMLVLLADKKRGIALQTVEKLNPLLRQVFAGLPEDEEEMEIQIVSTVRIQPDAGFISMESPLGRAVLGKKVGQTVHITVDDHYGYDVEIRAVEQATDDGTAPLMPY